MWAEVHDPGLWETIDNYGPKKSKMLMRVLMGSAQLLRSTATMNLPYMFSNVTRDYFTAKMYSPTGFGMRDLARGFMSVLNKDETWQQFMAAGGSQSAFISQDIDRQNRALRRMSKTKLQKFLDMTVLHPLDGLNALREATELATRLGVFRRQLSHELNQGNGVLTDAMMVNAAYVARESTQDFQKIGTEIREFNKVSAFTGSFVGGWTRVTEEAKNQPKRFFLRMTKYMMMSLALWALLRDDEEYAEVPAWEKSGYHHIPVWKLAEMFGGAEGLKAVKDLGMGPFIRFRRPFEFGDVANWIEAYASYATGKDPDWAKRLPVDITGYPADAALDATAELMVILAPDALMPMMEIFANYNFFRDQEIVQPYAPLEPALQYNRWTSESAKELGALINVSPARIDHLVYGYTSGIGRGVTAAIDEMFFLRDAPTPESDIPFGEFGVRAFYGGTSVGRASLQQFYERNEEIEGATTSIRTYLQRGGEGDREKAETIAKQAGLRVTRRRDSSGRWRYSYTSPERTRINTARRRLQDIRGAVDRVFNSTTMKPREKRKALEDLGLLQVNISREALGRPKLKRSYEVLRGAR